MLDKLGISPIDVSRYTELRGRLFDRPCALHYDGILVARLIYSSVNLTGVESDE